MKTTMNPLLAALAIVLVLSVNALARDVYPERKLEEVYVLEAGGNRALVKVKGAERESVAIGDVIGTERMTVVEINFMAIKMKSAYGDIATSLPVGGGMGF